MASVFIFPCGQSNQFVNLVTDVFFIITAAHISFDCFIEGVFILDIFGSFDNHRLDMQGHSSQFLSQCTRFTSQELTENVNGNSR